MVSFKKENFRGENLKRNMENIFCLSLVFVLMFFLIFGMRGEIPVEAFGFVIIGFVLLGAIMYAWEQSYLRKGENENNALPVIKMYVTMPNGKPERLRLIGTKYHAFKRIDEKTKEEIMNYIRKEQDKYQDYYAKLGYVRPNYNIDETKLIGDGT